MREPQRFCVSDHEVELFQADGAVVLRQLLAPAEVELLRAGIDENLAHPSPRAKVASARDDPGWFIEDFCCWPENSYYRRLIFGSALGEAGARLMRSVTARLYHDHMLTKEPGTRQPTPWHQDQPYYNISGAQNCSFWIPADAVSRPSTLEFVAGSHRGPWLMPRSFMDAQARWFPQGSLADLPDIEADRSRFRILGWALEPGDAVCFHMLTLHAAAGVSAGQRRRVFSVRLIGDDVRHAPRSWKTSPEFPSLTDLAPQAPLEHPLFPLLWPRPAEDPQAKPWVMA
jgi:ectoine hydroxylase-related dioxygenase (phytanoyl-CoA dioxygenase family)